jgi:hypothetical protein
MKFFRALLAGILGALTMSLVMFLLRKAGLNVNLEALLGSVIGGSPFSPWITGFLAHLGIGAVMGWLYAVGFEFAVQRSGILVGAGFGAAHGWMAGLFMSGIPAMNPLSASQSAPGAFLSNMYLGPLLFVLLHVAFGIVVGIAYGKPLQKAHPQAHELWH